MANLVTTRTALANALKAAGRVVYNYPAQLSTLPAIIIVPASPYVEVATIGAGRALVSFDVTLAVAATDNQGNLAAIEALILDVIAQIPNGYLLGSFTAPVPTEINGAPCVSSQVTVSTPVTL